MDEVYWVIDGVLAGRAGPEKRPWDPAELAAEGVGGIVSLCGPVDSHALRVVGIEHLPAYQPMILLESELERETFLDVVSQVLEFLEQIKAQQKATVIHCYHGCDRTGCVLSCVLIATQRLTAEQAIDRVKAANPFALAAYGYAEAVETFERLFEEDPERFGWRK